MTTEPTISEIAQNLEKLVNVYSLQALEHQREATEKIQKLRNDFVEATGLTPESVLSMMIVHGRAEGLYQVAEHALKNRKK